MILQVSDAEPAKWNLALNNARNIQAELGNDNVEIEIIAYGHGLAMLKSESKVAENTMTNTKVGKDDMYGGIAYVKAGVTHIMKRRQEGWAYIRP